MGTGEIYPKPDMPMYRVFFVDSHGHIMRPPEIIDATDDHKAIEQAKQFIDGLDLEVWLGARIVAKLPHKS